MINIAEITICPDFTNRRFARQDGYKNFAFAFDFFDKDLTKSKEESEEN